MVNPRDIAGNAEEEEETGQKAEETRQRWGSRNTELTAWQRWGSRNTELTAWQFHASMTEGAVDLTSLRIPHCREKLDRKQNKNGRDEIKEHQTMPRQLHASLTGGGGVGGGGWEAGYDC